MGKGTRKRISRENYLLEQEKKNKLEALRKKKMRKIGLIVTSCVLVMALIAGGAAYAVKLGKNNGYFIRNKIAAQSDSFKVDNAMMAYFVNQTYQSFISNNSSNLSNYGLDTSKPLKEQSNSDGVIWYDYFMQEAEDSIKQMLILSEAANKEGVTITDEELATIDTQMESITPSDYGQGVQISDIKNCQKLYMLAYKYSNQIIDNLKYTDIELENYYDLNKANFTTYDYRRYTFSYSTDDEQALTQVDAKTHADKLVACKSDSAYTVWLRNYMKASGNYSDNAAIQEALDGTLTENAAYTADDPLSEWAYTEGRQVGDTYLLDDTQNSGYTVYIMVAVPDRDISNTVDARHILLTFEKNGSDADTLKAAQAVYDEWKSGDQTEDSFAALAETKSEDPGSASQGGLYEGIYVGQTVDTFNDWCFDSSRKTGDTAIVATTYGYHIMYFVGINGEKWKSDVKDAIQKADYDKAYAEYETKYVVTINDKNLSEINIIQK